MEQFLDPDHIQRALATRSIYYVFKLIKKLSQSKAPGLTKSNDLFAIDINVMTRMHMVYIMYERARSRIESQNVQSENLKKIMMTVLANFALQQLKLDHSALYDCGFFGRGSSNLLKLSYAQTLVVLRP